ncbi:MAG: ABC transporter permease [Gemmatimonadetes bacterium]|nr:ABC transporter permease [Gemmatimonadota bacterium]
MIGREPGPPRLALWLLERCVPEAEREFLVGDLLESFAERVATGTPLRVARSRFWRETVAVALRRNRDLASTPFSRGLMTDLSLDVTLALRRLRRAPGFTLAASLTLALGIGAASLVLAVARPSLWGTLPFREADRIVTLRERFGDGSLGRVGFATIGDLAQRVPAFEAVAASSSVYATLSRPEGAVRLAGAAVSAPWFQVMGVTVAQGRTFLPEEDRPEAARAVILTDETWRRHFGADSGLIGRTIELTGTMHQVVGILPARFEPLLDPGAQYLRPLRYVETQGSACRDCRHLQAMARLRAGADRTEVQRQVEVAFEAMRAAYPQVYGQNGMVVTGLRDQVVEGVRRPLLALVGAATLLLLIALANTTNLFLARAVQRTGELTVRAALGASTWRLARGLALEALVVAALGVLFGVALAHAAVGTLVAIAPASLPRLDQVRVDALSMALASGMALLSGLVSGLVPSAVVRVRGMRARLAGASRAVVRGGHDRLRRALVVLEMAMALLLLGGAGVLVRSVQRLLSVDVGFVEQDRVSMALGVGGLRYAENATVWALWRSVHEAVQAIPGVTTASLTSQLPLSSDFDAYGLRWESKPTVAPAEDGDAFRYAVTPDYARTMGLRLHRGRFLDSLDRAGGDPVVVISAGLARRTFGEQDPLGARVRMGGGDPPLRTVVGVVNDVQHPTLDGARGAAIYLPLDQNAFADAHVRLVVQTAMTSAAAEAAVRSVLRRIDPAISIAEVSPLSEVVAQGARQRLFARLLFQVFSVAAMILAAVGIFGVMSGMVNERTREIGVRTALGATPARILTDFVRTGASLAAMGIMIGATGSLLLAGALRSLVFGVSPRDPVTLVFVSLGVGVVAIAATWWPARRATRLEASVALRSD